MIVQYLANCNELKPGQAGVNCPDNDMAKALKFHRDLSMASLTSGKGKNGKFMARMHMHLPYGHTDSDKNSRTVRLSSITG